MNKILILVLVIISINTFGQKSNNYIEYYSLTNEGDMQRYLKNDSLAYDCFLRALKKVDYVHSQVLVKAASLAVIHNDYKNTYDFSRRAVLLGYEYKFYKNKSYKQYRKTNYFKTFKDSLDIFKLQYKESLNLDYKNQIDSLYYIDQRIIRKNRTVKGDYNIDISKLPEDLFELDSLIFADFLALIDKYGFATEENVGAKTYSNVWLFYHHNIRLPKNGKYMELAQRAVKAGAYSPYLYAWMFDQSKSYKKEDPYFYYGVNYDIKKLEANRALINKRRKEWGIKPLEAQETVKRLNTTVTRQLW